MTEPSFSIELLEESAVAVTTNALVASRKQGLIIVPNACDFCRGTPHPQSICVCCSIGQFREFDAEDEDCIEYALSELFGLPEDWVLDFVGGFDGDPPEHADQHPNAAKLGRKLARKHVSNN